MAQNYNQLKSFTIKNYIYIHEYSPKIMVMPCVRYVC